MNSLSRPVSVCFLCQFWSSPVRAEHIAALHPTSGAIDQGFRFPGVNRSLLPLSLVEPAIDQTFTVDNIAPQVESIAYEDGSAQRSVIRSITVDFDSEVILDPEAFVLTTKAGDAVTLAAPVVSLVGGKTRAVLTFSGDHTDAGGSLRDGNYRLSVLDTHVRDLAGNLLDGNKDGDAGAPAIDDFFRLFGDSDGDRDVDGQDYGRMAQSFLKNLGEPGFNPSFDFDGDNDVDGQDYGQFASRVFTSLQA